MDGTDEVDEISDMGENLLQSALNGGAPNDPLDFRSRSGTLFPAKAVPVSHAWSHLSERRALGL